MLGDAARAHARAPGRSAGCRPLARAPGAHGAAPARAGDNAASARRVAAAVGIADVRAGLKPEDKLAAVNAARAGGAGGARGGGVIMVRPRFAPGSRCALQHKMFAVRGGAPRPARGAARAHSAAPVPCSSRSAYRMRLAAPFAGRGTAPAGRAGRARRKTAPR